MNSINIKEDIINQSEQVINLIRDKTKESIKQYSAEFVQIAEKLTGHIDQEIKDTFIKMLGGTLSDQSWKIRERCLMSLYIILEQKDNIEETIIKDIEKQILLRKSKETDERVRQLLDHKEYIQEMCAILKGNWEDNSEEIKEEILEGMKELDSLQQKIIDQPQQQVRELLIMKCQMIQDNFDKQLTNLSDMQSLMGIQIQFLKGMKQQLFQLQDTLNSVAKDINEIKMELQSLVGKSIPKLIELRHHSLQNHPQFQEVFIQLKCFNSFNLIRNDKQQDLHTEVLAFLKQNHLSTLLIYGDQGSGKSTYFKFLEKTLYQDYYTQKEFKTICIYCQLQNLKDPLNNLVNETLINDYGFSMNRIFELKELCQMGEINLLFILDGYNQVVNEFQYKNLYDTNNLELWGPILDIHHIKSQRKFKTYPKIIISCTAQFLEQQKPNYRNLFLPFITDVNKKSIYSPEKYYHELAISKLKCKNQKNQYINDFYLNKMYKILVKHLGIEQYQNNNQVINQKIEQLFEKIKEQFISNYNLSEYQDEISISSQSSELSKESDNETIIQKQILYERIMYNQEKFQQFIQNNPEFQEYNQQLLQFFKHIQQFPSPIMIENVSKLLYEFSETPYMLNLIQNVISKLKFNNVFTQKYLQNKFIENQKINEQQMLKYFQILIQQSQDIILDQYNQINIFENNELSITQEILNKYYGKICEFYINLIKNQEEFKQDDKYILIGQIYKIFKPQQFQKYELFDEFTKLIFENKIKQIQEKKEVNLSISPIDFHYDLLKYSQYLAIEMTITGANNIIYQQQGCIYRHTNQWDSFFYSQNNQLKKEIIDASLIQQIDDSWKFHHPSLQEFFFAQYIFQVFTFDNSKNIFFPFSQIQFLLIQLIKKIHHVVINQLKQINQTFKTLQQILLDQDYQEIFFQHVQEYQIKHKQSNINIHQVVKNIYSSLFIFIEQLVKFQLNSSFFLKQSNLINQFLIQKTQSDQEFNAILHLAIHLSKLNDQIKQIDFKNDIENKGIEQASSFAITLLNLSKQSFSNMNFDYVQIPFANLSNGFFHYTTFNNANLQGVKFENSYLVYTQFNDANLQQTILQNFNQEQNILIDPNQIKIKNINFQLKDCQKNTYLKNYNKYNKQTLQNKNQYIFTIQNDSIVYLKVNTQESKQQKKEFKIDLKEIFKIEEKNEDYELEYRLKNDFFQQRVILLVNLYDKKEKKRTIGVFKQYLDTSESDKDRFINENSIKIKEERYQEEQNNKNYQWDHQIMVDDQNIIYGEKNYLYIFNNHSKNYKNSELQLEEDQIITSMMIGEEKLYILDKCKNVMVYNYNKKKLKVQEQLQLKSRYKLEEFFSNYKFVSFFNSQNYGTRIILEYKMNYRKINEDDNDEFRHLNLVRIKNKEEQLKLTGLKDKLELIEFSTDNQQIIAACKKKLIYVWKVSTELSLQIFKCHFTNIIALNFSPCNNYIFSLDIDGFLHQNCSFFSQNHYNITVQNNFHLDYIKKLSFRSDNQVLYSSDNLTIIEWDVNFGTFISQSKKDNHYQSSMFMLKRISNMSFVTSHIYASICINNYYNHDDSQIISKQQWQKDKKYKILKIFLNEACNSNKQFNEFIINLKENKQSILTFSFDLKVVVWFDNKQDKICIQNIENKFYYAELIYDFDNIKNVQIDYYGKIIIIVQNNYNVEIFKIRKIYQTKDQNYKIEKYQQQKIKKKDQKQVNENNDLIILNFMTKLKYKIYSKDQKQKYKEISISQMFQKGEQELAYKEKKNLFIVQILKEFKIAREFKLVGHTNEIMCIEFSENGQLLVSSDLDDNIIIWCKKVSQDSFNRWSLKIRLGQFSQAVCLYQGAEKILEDIVVSKRGNKYYGSKKDGMKHGFGICQFANGSLYEGIFVNNKFEGKGKLVDIEGNLYKGMFKQHQKNGQGQYWNKDYYYVGMWNHDMKNGKGSMYYHHSMSCYHGDFKKDLFHGQGQLVFNYHCHPKTTYILYNGMFHRGKKHGYGELIEFNQNNIVKITGLFKDDKPANVQEKFIIQEKQESVQNQE